MSAARKLPPEGTQQTMTSDSRALSQNDADPDGSGDAEQNEQQGHIRIHAST